MYREGLNRPEDFIHRAYCHFMLIRKKFEYNIYEEVEKVVDDTMKCEQLLLQVRNMAEGEADTFLTTEIPFLLSQSLEWINKRADEKKHDTVFMKRFAPTNSDESSDQID